MTKTFSENYQKLQRQLHDENHEYGSASTRYINAVLGMLNHFNLKTVTDYGAGKKRLYEGLKNHLNENEYFPYDPAFPEYGEPKNSDLVCCFDVLEHIEPEFIDNIINDLSTLTIKFGFFTIHTGPAGKFLKDGWNAHLIQKPIDWWLEKLDKKFDLWDMKDLKPVYAIIVKSKNYKV